MVKPDVEAPRFTRPSNFEVLTDDRQAFALVSLPLPTGVTDNSGRMVTITTSPANNSQVDIGQQNITYTLTDVYGNIATFTLTVTVRGESHREICRFKLACKKFLSNINYSA